MDDLEEFLNALGAVYTLYGQELTETTIRLWRMALDGYDAGQIDRAITAHVRDPKAGRFIPRPADIIGRLEHDADAQALIAWGEVLSGARRGGGAALDPSARAALDSLGGWGAVCRADESENGFLQRRFVDAYRAYRGRAEVDRVALGGAELRRIK